MTHTFVLLAFLLFIVATVTFGLKQDRLGWLLLAAGLACYVLPAAFQLHS